MAEVVRDIENTRIRDRQNGWREAEAVELIGLGHLEVIDADAPGAGQLYIARHLVAEEGIGLGGERRNTQQQS